MLNLLLVAALLAAAPQGGPPVDPAIAHLNGAQGLIKQGDFAAALARLEEARKIGTRPVPVALWTAVAHARMNKPDEALEELMKAAGLGLGALPPAVASDSAIVALKTHARYAELERALDRNARPCEYDPAYRQFDYWLGDWDVRPNGAPTAPPSRNVITKIHNGCVILETWTAPGSTGQSFNIYDRVSAAGIRPGWTAAAASISTPAASSTAT